MAFLGDLESQRGNTMTLPKIFDRIIVYEVVAKRAVGEWAIRMVLNDPQTRPISSACHDKETTSFCACRVCNRTVAPLGPGLPFVLASEDFTCRGD